MCERCEKTNQREQAEKAGETLRLCVEGEAVIGLKAEGGVTFYTEDPELLANCAAQTALLAAQLSEEVRQLQDRLGFVLIAVGALSSKLPLLAATANPDQQDLDALIADAFGRKVPGQA